MRGQGRERGTQVGEVGRWGQGSWYCGSQVLFFTGTVLGSPVCWYWCAVVTVAACKRVRSAGLEHLLLASTGKRESHQVGGGKAVAVLGVH